jgi:hypothetical protein
MLHKYQLPNMSGVKAKLIGHTNRNCLLSHVTEARRKDRNNGQTRKKQANTRYWGKESILDRLRKKWTNPELLLGAGCYKIPKKNVCGFVSGGWLNTVSQARSLNKFSVHHVTCMYDSNAIRWSVHIAQVVSQVPVLVHSLSWAQNELRIHFS